MKLIKNYFTVFFICVFISIFAKLIFAFYGFADIEITEKLYAVFYGYKFDFAVSAIIAFLTLFFDFNKKLLLGVVLLLMLLLFGFLMGDIMYFNDTSRHISYEIKDAVAEAQGLLGITLRKYLELFILGLISSAIFGVVFFKLLNKNLSAVKFTKSYLPVKLLLIAVSVFFVRGMVQHIPLNPSHAYKIGNPKLAMLSLNGAYNVIYQNIKNKGDIEMTPKYQVYNEAQSIKSLYMNNSKGVEYQKELEHPNIVLLFLESWGASFLKDYGGQSGQDHTLIEYNFNL
ncbi:hypothetical protein QJU96_08145 [Pasteurella skyensis]|uniref:Sulfatase n=1 Tax=Phocoenobacter skyensis TaxID=97481 RepID=A0AAJ6P382_9PAST|nr:hypothetical protein [Pasteurella skyensis]MDP8171255.1 hypothetical protein [Pasteurella skyensis]MDP8175488.1 hypothetical protein [Pasteurella skyensis]